MKRSLKPEEALPAYMQTLPLGYLIESVDDCGSLGDRVEMFVQEIGTGKIHCLVSDKATTLAAIGIKLMVENPFWESKAFESLQDGEKRHVASYEPYSLYSKKDGEKFALVAESEFSNLTLFRYERQSNGKFAAI
jgi:hypothetical protein